MEHSFLPKTRKELAIAYGVSRKTLYRWASNLKIQERKMLTKACLKSLYSKYGNPYKVNFKINSK